MVRAYPTKEQIETTLDAYKVTLTELQGPHYLNNKKIRKGDPKCIEKGAGQLGEIISIQYIVVITT